MGIHIVFRYAIVSVNRIHYLVSDHIEKTCTYFVKLAYLRDVLLLSGRGPGTCGM